MVQVERRAEHGNSSVSRVANVILLSFVLVSMIVMPLIPAARSATTYDVSIVNLAFQPADLNIQVGDTVRWTNTVSTTHSVVSDTGATDSFNSGPLGQNDVFTHTFDTVGDSPYHCGFHPSMLGTVHVSTVVPEFSFLPIVLLGMVAIVLALSGALRKA